MDWRLEVVIVPVGDVDRAKEFYSESVGFHVDLDHQVSDDVRIVQLTPPGSGCSICIGAGITGASPGSAAGLQVVVPDVAAAHAELTGRGVEVSPVRHMEGGQWVDGPGGKWNSFVHFADPDGNPWTVQETPAVR
jgi:catechol 2,3-dioxygenase-like lactoylglutathione lyase family enzyme